MSTPLPARTPKAELRLTAKPTRDQYDACFRLISSGAGMSHVVAASGLSKTQVQHLISTGYPDDGMPAIGTLVIEQAAAFRLKARDAAAELGEQAGTLLKRQAQLTATAQQLVMAAMQSVAVELKAAKDTGKGPQLDRNMIELLKALRPYSDVGPVGDAFRSVFDGGTSTVDPVSRVPRGSAGVYADDLVPAIVSHTADTGGSDLSDLIPDIRDWSEDELLAYATTGERPTRDPPTSPGGA